MSIPVGYDPVTLNHWLWYKYRCHEGSPTDFQSLFENIMKRARPEFMQIRPYGNIGDRKADGLLFCEEAVFQVYSPDLLTQRKVMNKINEDLDGAVAEWKGNLKKWVFVYNVRRGLAPDIAKILQKKKKQYPQLEIEPLSNDSLWEIARGLSLQQRAEILGAPSGYEGMFLVPNESLKPELLREPPPDAWLVLIQDDLVPVDIRSVFVALKPGTPFGMPIFIRPERSSWGKIAEYQRSHIKDILAKSRSSLPPRFAIFSVAPIPQIIHLGFLLSDSVQTRCFKLHIDSKSWEWPLVTPQETDTNIQVRGLPAQETLEACEVLIRVSFSASVGQYETDEVAPDTPIQVDVFVEHPSLTWIRNPIQLEKLAEVFRSVLAQIRQNVPHCQRIHLFCAVPAPAAVVIGQQINPRMNPPVSLYDYARQKTPRYEFALTLDIKESVHHP